MPQSAPRARTGKRRRSSGSGAERSQPRGSLGVSVKVKAGDQVKAKQPLFIIEAMKMESTVTSSQDGTVKRVYLHGGDMVEQDDMVIELE